MKMKIQTTAHAETASVQLVMPLDELTPFPDRVVLTYHNPVEALNDACRFVEQALNAVRRAALL